MGLCEGFLRFSFLFGFSLGFGWIFLCLGPVWIVVCAPKKGILKIEGTFPI